MKAKELNKLLKEKNPAKIIEDYMTNKIFLTDIQLQKVLDLKLDNEKGHGGCILGSSDRKRGKKWLILQQDLY